MFPCTMLSNKLKILLVKSSHKKTPKHQVRTNSYCTKSLETTLMPRNFVENDQFLTADAGDLA